MRPRVKEVILKERGGMKFTLLVVQLMKKYVNRVFYKGLEQVKNE